MQNKIPHKNGEELCTMKIIACMEFVQIFSKIPLSKSTNLLIIIETYSRREECVIDVDTRLLSSEFIRINSDDDENS